MAEPYLPLPDEGDWGCLSSTPQTLSRDFQVAAND